MARSYRGGDDFRPVDEMMRGDEPRARGVTFQDAVLLAKNGSRLRVDLDGEPVWVSTSSIIRSDLHEVGDTGEFEITERAAINLGLV